MELYPIYGNGASLSVVAHVMVLLNFSICLSPQEWPNMDFLIMFLCCAEHCTLHSESFPLHLLKLNLKEYIFLASPRRRWYSYSGRYLAMSFGVELFLKEDTGFPPEHTSKTIWSGLLRTCIPQNPCLGRFIGRH